MYKDLKKQTNKNLLNKVVSSLWRRGQNCQGQDIFIRWGRGKLPRPRYLAPPSPARTFHLEKKQVMVDIMKNDCYQMIKYLLEWSLPGFLA